MSRRSKVIVHPLLFSIYPVLFLFANNMSEAPPSDVILPMAVVLVLCAVVWLVAGLVFRDVAKGALAATLSMLMLLLFGSAHRAFMDVTGWAIRNHYAVPFWLLLYAAGLYAIRRAKRGVPVGTRLANLISVVSVLMVAVPIAGASLERPAVGRPPGPDSSGSDWGQSHVRSGGERPDIYYIILDGYGRADALKKAYGFDNTAFLRGLEAKGFVVVDRSTSNYANTQESLASSLNMSYLHPVEEDAPGAPDIASLPPPLFPELLARIEYNRVAQVLRALGYRYVFVPSGGGLTDRSRLADRIIDTGALTRSTLFYMLVDESALRCALEMTSKVAEHFRKQALHDGVWLSLSGAREWHRHITDSLAAIGEIPCLEEPTFTFAHILCPHLPYVFNRDGSVNGACRIKYPSNANEFNVFNSPQYIDQLIHLNTLVEAMVTRILERSTPPPIIILQADHGTLALAGPKIGGWLKNPDPSHELIRERMSILLACYAPQPMRARLHDSVTPVNIFRIIFNECFGAAYPLLPDRNFWWSWRSEHEVTAIIAAGAR